MDKSSHDSVKLTVLELHRRTRNKIILNSQISNTQCKSVIMKYIVLIVFPRSPLEGVEFPLSATMHLCKSILYNPSGSAKSGSWGTNLMLSLPFRSRYWLSSDPISV